MRANVARNAGLRLSQMRARSASHHDGDDSGAFGATPQLTSADSVPASEGRAMSESESPSVTAGLRATLGRRWNWAWEPVLDAESGGEPRGEREEETIGDDGRALDARSPGVGVRWSLGLPCVELDLERVPDAVPLAGALSVALLVPGVSLGLASVVPPGVNDDVLETLPVVPGAEDVLDTLPRVAAVDAAVSYPVTSSELMGGVACGLGWLAALDGERRSDGGLRGDEYDGETLSWLPLRLR